MPRERLAWPAEGAWPEAGYSYRLSGIFPAFAGGGGHLASPL
jgi:hypothetical protein